MKPGSMLVVGGRSDTYGVLSSVELITSGKHFSNFFGLFVYLLVCPIITQEPLTDLPQILIGELVRTTEIVLVCLDILSSRV